MKKKDSNYYSVTTGSLATAAALSALKALISSTDIYLVRIETPKKTIDIEIDTCQKLSSTSAMACTHKYPYNDPDVTVNVKIVATVNLIKKESEETIFIKGGKGVGIVTKPGLQIPVGEAAINPVPREMIKKNLEPLIPEGKAIEVEISVPEGEKVSQKTMNPKLGIKGGISILGTTGIAKSMSSEAYKNSIVYQIDVALALNFENLIFVPGNIGEKIALKKLNIEKEQIIQTGNYAGFMFEEGKKRGIKKIVYFGHLGKVIKIAGGIFNTKNSVADGRKEIMITHAAINGASTNLVKKIYDSKTTEDMLTYLEEENLKEKVMNSIQVAIKERIKFKFDIEADVVIVDMKGNFLNTNYSLEGLK